eukprot:GILI01003965.1.p1 GENE.GILI01003965.1~~GILI01003965.1.p1  ORF type:complete len:150 (-),score=27.19 GILI01003965.1:83-532(-)
MSDAPKPNITVRELQASDSHEQFINLLSHLTTAPQLSSDEFLKIFKERQSQGVFTRVALTDSGDIVGTTSVVIETKFFRGGASIGHIEDVVVHPDFRGCGVARKLMDSCVEVAKEKKCYKLILDCKDDNIPLYTKMGFELKEFQMRKDL